MIAALSLRLGSACHINKKFDLLILDEELNARVFNI